MTKGFNDDSNKHERIYIGLIAKRIMNEINGTAKKEQGLNDIGVIGESFLQQSLVEITHSFIKAMGTINSWGFGEKKSMTLVTFLSLPNSKKVDCLNLIIWRYQLLEKHFIDTHLQDANRNPLNLRIIARNTESNFILPYTFKPNPSVSEFFQRIGERPNEEIELVKQQGQDHLIVGFKAKNLTRYQIAGLYDLSHIDRKISRQKNDLILFCIFSIILAFILAQFLTQSFLFPISSLREAAIAIENREFDHQVNLKTKDEFGEIAEIFNNVLVGMEELQVAKIVQESLFPKPSFEQNNFKVFGKSITMNELGGDYLDFIKISDDQFSILMGDVAGHGVGAAVIMAMAKAGILSSTSYLTEPLELITRLHQLIYSSKTKKQKKIMTFQYLFIDGNEGKGIYTNAGACSPIYLNKATGETKEVSLPGAALGAFKRAKFKTLDIQFEPGDAMIFYTDGIIEAHNSDGEEIGYGKFSQMVADSWNKDPEVYYQNLYQSYLEHIGEADAEDDLTIMIAIYNPDPAESPKSKV
jgi:serine phosphatase RsbU (regulator of sigma subunit)